MKERGRSPAATVELPPDSSE